MSWNDKNYKKTDFECESFWSCLFWNFCANPCTLLEIPGFDDQIAEAFFDKNDCRAEFLVNDVHKYDAI
jgi:hypothetical protein